MLLVIKAIHGNCLNIQQIILYEINQFTFSETIFSDHVQLVLLTQFYKYQEWE